MRIDPIPPNHETALVMRALRADATLMAQASSETELAALRSLCRDRLTLTDQTLFFAEWVWLRDWLQRASRRAA